MSRGIGQLRAIGFAIALAIFLADQATKYIVTWTLDLKYKGQIELLPIFNLTWAENYGVSLGMLTANHEWQRWGLVLMTLAIALGVLVWMLRERRGGDIAALGLILGGAAGNIVDRFRFGYVVDFADLHFGGFRPFLIFNVADVAITFGVLILLARALLMREKEPEPIAEPAGEELS